MIYRGSHNFMGRESPTERNTLVDISKMDILKRANLKQEGLR
ncbi:hypothetical protein [Thermococcus sp.]